MIEVISVSFSKFLLPISVFHLTQSMSVCSVAVSKLFTSEKITIPCSTDHNKHNLFQWLCRALLKDKQRLGDINKNLAVISLSYISMLY